MKTFTKIDIANMRLICGKLIEYHSDYNDEQNSKGITRTNR